MVLGFPLRHCFIFFQPRRISNVRHDIERVHAIRSTFFSTTTISMSNVTIRNEAREERALHSFVLLTLVMTCHQRVRRFLFFFPKGTRSYVNESLSLSLSNVKKRLPNKLRRNQKAFRALFRVEEGDRSDQILAFILFLFLARRLALRISFFFFNSGCALDSLLFYLFIYFIIIWDGGWMWTSMKIRKERLSDGFHLQPKTHPIHTMRNQSTLPFLVWFLFIRCSRIPIEGWKKRVKRRDLWKPTFRS